MTRMARKQDKPALTLQHMEVIDLTRVISLEAASYPPDEAASPLDLEYRAMVARQFCVVAFIEGRKDFIGFVAATAAPDDTRAMTPDMMKNHHAFGNVLCIHSVVIDPQYRRQGFGTSMMNAYLRHVKRNSSIKTVLLLSKQYLVPFYEALGFRVLGESSISHGKEKWMEMTQDL